MMHEKNLQGPVRHQYEPHHAEANILEDIILKEAGITCGVKTNQDQVKIKVKNYRDFVLAKSAIKGRVSLPIIHDEK